MLDRIEVVPYGRDDFLGEVWKVLLCLGDEEFEAHSTATAAMIGRAKTDGDVERFVAEIIFFRPWFYYLSDNLDRFEGVLLSKIEDPQKLTVARQTIRRIKEGELVNSWKPVWANSVTA